jgi:hypothetical protein
MSTNQTNHQTVFEPAAGSTEIRELNLSELQQVSGGLPHRTWRVATPTAPTSEMGTDPLPHGSW